MENTPTWNIQQTWGSDRFFNEGDVAQDTFAFVIDSGVSLETGDLNINREWSKSFAGSGASLSNPFDDQTGHGTAVASIIGAKADNQGLTGVAPGAQIVSLKVFGGSGSTSNGVVIDALEYARDVIVANNLFDKAVINLSLGTGAPLRHPIVREMADLGIKFAVAAGNSGRDVDGYSPAGYGDHENVYTVSSYGENGYYSTFTNWDGLDLNGEDDTDFAAPGSKVPTYNTDGTISTRNGTSFSAPHVAGLLLMSDEIRPGATKERSAVQVEKGMLPDPTALFDPYTYKHGPSIGEPAPPPPIESLPPVPEPIIVEVPVPGPVVEVPVPDPYPVPVPVDPITGEWDENNKLRGTREDDFILGGSKRDMIKGGRGDDTIIAFGGKNRVRGGEGSDTFLIDADGLTRVIDYHPGEDTVLLPDGYGLDYKNGNTQVFLLGEKIAKIDGIHSFF